MAASGLLDSGMSDVRTHGLRRTFSGTFGLFGTAVWTPGLLLLDFSDFRLQTS